MGIIQYLRNHGSDYNNIGHTSWQNLDEEQSLSVLCHYSPQRLPCGITQKLYLVIRKYKELCLKMNSKKESVGSLL